MSIAFCIVALVCLDEPFLSTCCSFVCVVYACTHTDFRWYDAGGKFNWTDQKDPHRHSRLQVVICGAREVHYWLNLAPNTWCTSSKAARGWRGAWSSPIYGISEFLSCISVVINPYSHYIEYKLHSKCPTWLQSCEMCTYRANHSSKEQLKGLICTASHNNLSQLCWPSLSTQHSCSP